MNINEQSVHALYIINTAFKVKKISFDDWQQCLCDCQKAIIEEDNGKLEQALIKGLGIVNPPA